MDKAANKQEFIAKVADDLFFFDKVYYDADTLCFYALKEDWFFEYGDYLELDDEALDKVPEDELNGWRRDQVKDIREALQLKSVICKPEPFEDYDWMGDFVVKYSDNRKFADDAFMALRNRHPFRGFRSVVYRYGMSKLWEDYRCSRLVDYVKTEMGLTDSVS